MFELMVDLSPRYRRFRWLEQEQQKVVEALESAYLKDMRQALLQSDLNIIQHYEEIIQAIKPLLIKDRPLKTQSSFLNKWYDSECINFKK